MTTIKIQLNLQPCLDAPSETFYAVTDRRLHKTTAYDQLEYVYGHTRRLYRPSFQ